MTLSNPAQYISGRTVQEQMNSLIDYVDQRAADVALDAIASDVAQVHQDMLDADADAAAAAASAAAAAGTLANAVKKTGEASQSIEGDVSLSTGDLSVAGDAAVQGQLSVIGGCDLRAPVKVPTVATGTFDDNAANGNKLKNELDNYAPMVRTTGNQSISGEKTFNGRLFLNSAFNYKPVLCLSRPDATKAWRKLYTAQGGSMSSFTLMLQERNTIGILTVGGYGNANQAAQWNLAPTGITKANYLVTVKSDGVIEVWHKQADAYDTLVGMVMMEWFSGVTGMLTSYVLPADYTTQYEEPQAADYTQYITPS